LKTQYLQLHFFKSHYLSNRFSKATILKGVKWNTIAQALAAVLQMLQLIALTRLLSPEDWGLMAMAWVVIRLITPLFSGGIGQSIIQQKDLSHLQFSSIFWVQILLGFLAFALIHLSIPLWVNFFEVESISTLLFIGSFSFLIIPPGNTFQAILTRHLAFGKLAGIQVGGILSDIAVSLFLALKGWGAEAIVWGFLTRSIVSTLLSWIFCYKDQPDWSFDLKPIRSMLKFALFETANNLVFSLSTIVDKAILSRFLSSRELGLYFIAWELAMIPVSRINPLLTRIAFPVFSIFQDQPRAINAYFLKMTYLLSIVNFPFLAILALFAQPILKLAFGPEWAEAGTCLSLLSVLGAARAVSNSGSGVLLAKGRSDLNFFWNLTMFLSFVLFLFAGLSINNTIEFAALSQIIAMISISGIWLHFLNRFGGVELVPFFKILVKRVLAISPVILISSLWFLLDISPVLITTGGIISALVLYLFTLLFFEKTAIQKILQ
jgi:O-antigen/teichoic acid export membrane protein